MLQAQATIAIVDPEEQILQSAELTQQLIQATEPQNRSLLPNDLQTSTRVLTTVLQVLENNDNATADLVNNVHYKRLMYKLQIYVECNRHI